jgi:hypothetical protein
VRSKEEYEAALDLIDQGINDCEIGRRLGISRVTIRGWGTARAAGSGGRTTAWTGKRHGAASCFRCAGTAPFDPKAYAYLLGIYLGDGTLTRFPRDVYDLRVSCDLKYPDIVNEIATAITIVRGSDTVGFVLSPGCVVVHAYWKHWPCLFPQHGHGRKHQRRIVLASWQADVVAEHPDELVRGLIQSDGNRHVNRVRGRLDRTKHYEYLRYMFTNASEDILRIFTDALDLLGVHWTRTTQRVISVARRDDVAYLDTFVGPKL